MGGMGRMQFQWAMAVVLVTALISAGESRSQGASGSIQGRATARADRPNPEATPRGRTVYMGRNVAETMGWRDANWLMREARENEENGQKLRAWLDVQPGAVVADFGCGNGYHTLPLAAAVGPKGKVYGVDLQPEMLEFLTERAEAEAAKRGTPLNLEPILATIDDPKLPPKSCDVILMVDVYHELSHPTSILGAVRSALREDGVVVLVEYRAEDRSVPIKPDHKMDKAQILAEMAANGFKLAAETNELPWQHAMAFEAISVMDWDAKPALGWDGARPRFESEVMAQGFIDAMAKGDPRVVAPFLAEAVATDGGLPHPGRFTSKKIGGWMKESAVPLIPAGTTFELQLTGSGYVTGTLTPPEGKAIHEDRLRIGLAKNFDGLWLVDTWLPSR
jgi:predicted methyltransferase